MKVSQFIRLLQDKLRQHGDREVEITWEGTADTVHPDAVYLDKSGVLTIDAEGNGAKPSSAVDIHETWVDIDGDRAWTPEKPTEPGWYWYRDPIVELFITEVVKVGDHLETMDDGFQHRVDSLAGEWSGPLEPPT